jgi:hypothetical protein
MARKLRRPWRLVENATGQIHGTFSTPDKAWDALAEWSMRECGIHDKDFSVKRRRK